MSLNLSLTNVSVTAGLYCQLDGLSALSNRSARITARSDSCTTTRAHTLHGWLFRSRSTLDAQGYPPIVQHGPYSNKLSPFPVVLQCRARKNVCCWRWYWSLKKTSWFYIVGITGLPKKWRSVIEHDGHYFDSICALNSWKISEILRYGNGENSPYNSMDGNGLDSSLFSHKFEIFHTEQMQKKVFPNLPWTKKTF